MASVAWVRGVRGRLLILAAVVAVLAGVSSWAILNAADAQEKSRQPTQATRADTALDMGTVLDKPHIVFRSTSPGPTFGQLAAVPLGDPSGSRSVSGLVCERVYATGSEGICLKAEGAASVRHPQTMLGPRLTPIRQLPLGGLPSRARFSRDGSLVSTTVFVTGHGYATLGFSTETIVRDLKDGIDYGNLEKTFETRIDPRRNHATDLNIWGVTFVPGKPDDFYATAAAGGGTWLMKGSLRDRTLTAVRTDVECPSISPDGRYIAYKKRNGSPINWRLHVLDLRTGLDRALPETRSVDDQVEWLDGKRVLYGISTGGKGDSNVWVSALAGGKPRIFIRHASSPAVVR